MRIAVQGCCHGELDQFRGFSTFFWPSMLLTSYCRIYSAIAFAEKVEGIKIDLLLICGDFQAVRNHDDLVAMACPTKFKRMNTFYKYYTGERVAPVLTLFIGGNHEASDYLWELFHGGWVAPNIYFLGAAGVVRVRGLRIGGVSGIFKGYSFNTGHYERPALSEDGKRSIYHERVFEAYQFSLLRYVPTSPGLDIVMSHDWPRGITRYGNEAELVNRKPFFRDEVATNTLGSPAWETLLHLLRPLYWFSAHLHVKFAALVPHDPVIRPPDLPAPRGPAPFFLTAQRLRPGMQHPVQAAAGSGSLLNQPPPVQAPRPRPVNPEAIDIDGDATDDTADQRKDGAEKVPAAAEVKTDNQEQAGGAATSQEPERKPRSAPSSYTPAAETRFLALDKCLPNRDFLQIIEVPDKEETPSGTSASIPELHYDIPWLTVLERTYKLFPTHREQLHGQDRGTYREQVMAECPSEEDVKRVEAALHKANHGTTRIMPDRFARTAVTSPDTHPSQGQNYGRGSKRQRVEVPGLPPAPNPQTKWLLNEVLGLDMAQTIFNPPTIAASMAPSADIAPPGVEPIQPGLSASALPVPVPAVPLRAPLSLPPPQGGLPPPTAAPPPASNQREDEPLVFNTAEPESEQAPTRSKLSLPPPKK